MMSNAEKRIVERMRRQELEKRGASREKREDRHGDTKTGWWLDGVYLGRTTEESIRAMNGN